MIFLCFGNSLTAGWPGYYPHSDGVSRGNGNIQSQYEYWLKGYCVEYIEKKKNKEKVSISKEIIFVNKTVITVFPTPPLPTIAILIGFLKLFINLTPLFSLILL